MQPRRRSSTSCRVSIAELGERRVRPELYARGVSGPPALGALEAVPPGIRYRVRALLDGVALDRLGRLTGVSSLAPSGSVAMKSRS